MKKEFIMIILIITVVTIGHIITQNYTKNFFDDIENDLLNLEDKILSENNKNSSNTQGNEKSQESENGFNINKEAIENDMEKIQNKWQEKYDVLAYYIEHDELEKIETQITLISSTIKVEEYEDFIMETDRCIFLMDHIKDKEALKLVNIF